MDIICKECGVPKEESKFYMNRTSGRTYRKSVCKACDNKKRNQRLTRSYAYLCAVDPLYLQKQRKRQGAYRNDPNNRAAIIYKDSRKSDKFSNRQNNLDHDWIKLEIVNGCSYCGEREMIVTLDRIDNEKGHTKDNVRAACIRCNLIRRDMPFEAWLLLIDGIRKARELGFFKDWSNSPHKGRVGHVLISPSVSKTDVPQGLEG